MAVKKLRESLQPPPNVTVLVATHNYIVTLLNLYIDILCDCTVCTHCTHIAIVFLPFAGNGARNNHHADNWQSTPEALQKIHVCRKE